MQHWSAVRLDAAAERLALALLAELVHLALGEGGHVLEGRRLEAAGLEDVGDRRAEVAERLRRVRVEHVAQHRLEAQLAAHPPEHEPHQPPEQLLHLNLARRANAVLARRGRCWAAREEALLAHRRLALLAQPPLPAQQAVEEAEPQPLDVLARRAVALAEVGGAALASVCSRTVGRSPDPSWRTCASSRDFFRILF